MPSRTLASRAALCLLGFILSPAILAQQPPPQDPGAARPRGPGGPGGFGGPPMGVVGDTKLVKQFDKNGDKRLDKAERQAAREWLAKEKAEGRGPRRMGPPRGAESAEPAQPGPKLAPADVKQFPNADLYDPSILRTLFLTFEGDDWEKELADFYHTDVDVPATLEVDGVTLRDVGLHFRGASSFFTVAAGRKRSLNLSVDFAHKDQKLRGYSTLNLLNSHTDPSFMRSALYYHVARQYMPAPNANFVRLVINGESWGVYVNAQQVNREFLKDWYGTTEGIRWKVPGSPRATGGLAYLGDDVAEYRKRYEMKTGDSAKAWNDLIQLCKTLSQTPPAELEAALQGRLDIEGVLRFLALENVFINSDGYWIRSSDFHIYQDPKGMFHIIPHDSNETFRPAMGPGFGGGGGRGIDLDPLVGADNPDKPLLSKLLAVPALRARYFALVHGMARDWLDWQRLEPLLKSWQALIADDVRKDTRKLYSFEAFQSGAAGADGERGAGGVPSIQSFARQRREFLLEHPEVKAAPAAAMPSGKREPSSGGAAR